MKAGALLAALLSLGVAAHAVELKDASSFWVASYGMGTAPDCIGIPAAMAADTDGNLYVVDEQNHRTALIRKDGTMEAFSPGFDIFIRSLVFDANRLVGFGKEPTRTLQVLDLATRTMVFDIGDVWSNDALRKRMAATGFAPTLVAGDLLLSEDPDGGGYRSLQFFPEVGQGGEAPIFRDPAETKRFLTGIDGRNRKLTLDATGVLIRNGQPLAWNPARILSYWNASRRDKIADNPLEGLAWPMMCLFDRFSNHYFLEDLKELAIRNRKGDVVARYKIPAHDDNDMRLATVDTNGTVYFLASVGSRKYDLYRIPRKW